MRVAVITQYFPTSLQPWAGHSAYQTLRHLARQCELKVFYPHATDAIGIKPASRRGQKVLDPAYRPEGVDVQYISYPVIPVLSRPLNGWVAASKLFRHVKTYRPDLILSYVVYPDGFAAVEIGKRLNVPIILTAIGSDLNRMSDPFCAALTRSTLRRANLTTTVSSDLMQTARRLGAPADRTLAILNGCDTEVFRMREMHEVRKTLNLPLDEEIVVYVGRYDLRKGLIELIQASSALRKSRPRLHCYLIGDGPDKPALVEEIRKHNAEEWVSLIPPCTSKEIAIWMSAADLVTLPSYKEGCPNVVIEALATGRPVVATRVGGIPELMDDSSGRLIPPAEVDSLTRALDETLSKPWNYQEIAQQHNRRWEDVACDLLRALDNTLRTSHTV